MRAAGDLGACQNIGLAGAAAGDIAFMIMDVVSDRSSCEKDRVALCVLTFCKMRVRKLCSTAFCPVHYILE